MSVFTKPLFQIGQTPVTLGTLVQLVVIIALVLVLARVLRRLLRTRLLARSKLEPGLQDAIARIAGYLVVVLGLVVGLETIGVDLRSFTVIAGALSVGIGFGLQTIISNFVSGLIILAERPIQVGDRVEVAGTVGKVVRIGARATHVLTNDNILIICPNTEFVTNRVTNWTHIDPRVRFRVPVGVSYDSDPQLVRKLLLEVAAGNPHVLTDPAPSVVFQQFGDNALQFELRIWSNDMAHRPGTLESELNFAIWEKFNQHRIAFPVPQRELHLRAPVRVELLPQ